MLFFLSVISNSLLLFLLVIQCLLSSVSLLCSGFNGGESSSGNAAWMLGDDSWNYWWSYSGISGPAYWGLLNEDWFICDKGRRQSPINIDTSSLVYDPHLTPLRLDNNLISGLLYNDGHAIVLNSTASISHLTTQHIVDTDYKNNNNLQSNQAANNSLGVKRSIRNSNEPLSILKGQYETTNDAVFSSGTKLFTSGGEQNLIDSLQNTAQLAGESIDLTIEQDEKLNSHSESLIGSQDTNNGENVELNHDSTLDQDEQNDEIDPSNNQFEFSGAGLAYTYKFETLTLRFSLDSKLGSEHQINSRSYVAELQLLAYNSLLYKSYSSASMKPNGLLGIAILVEVFNNTANQPMPVNQVKQTYPTPTPNVELDLLLANLNEVKNRGSSTMIRNLNLTALLPETNYFVTYQGSLTVPGCHESVTWLVLNKPLYIKQSKLDAMRSISSSEPSNAPTGNLIAGNIRPAQPVNNRPIRTNIIPSPQSQGQQTCQRLWTRYEYKQAQ